MDDERPFRLRPRRPRQGRDESKVWARGFQQLMHLVRMTAKPLAIRLGRGSRNHRAGFQNPRHNQRCAVRVTYTRNKTRGQWAAHGRYIVRDSATALRPDGTPAFGSVPEHMNIPEALAAWQKSGDERLFKFVFSPEFGERLDLEQLTRDVMAAVGTDVGRSLEWAAVIHRNTEHAHVHVVLRGEAAGEPLRFAREYVQHGIRRHAENACTLQLGYRTSLDMEEAERREVAQARFTSLDRILSRARPAEADAASSFEVSRCPDGAELNDFARAREQRLVARLNYLAEIGLAERSGPLTWKVRGDFEGALRTFQRAGDRQKMLAQHAAFLSDPRFQYRVLTPDPTIEIDGRIIASTGGRAARTVEDLGDAEKLLSNRSYLKRTFPRLVQGGVVQEQDQSWSGWLGRYRAAIRDQARCDSEKTTALGPRLKKSERGRSAAIGFEFSTR